MPGRLLNEAEIIALIRELAGEPPPGVEVPIGDDAASYHFTGGDVLATVDSIYEGVHFNLDTFHLSDVGWKAAAAGVSDIAAMGGQPSCALLSLAFAQAPTAEDVRALVSGLIEMLASCSCALVGGDVCRSGGGLALTVTVLGTPPPGGPVLRGGAGEGDIIGLTGCVGDSGAGLFILELGRDELRSRYPRLVEAHLRPRPRVEAAGLLAAAGASAMEDVSDGLAADLSHICEMSALGCEVEECLLPLGDDLRAFAGEVGEDPLRWALSGGEDYELLFTAPPDRFETACGSLLSSGIAVARLGSMNAGGARCVLLRDNGERVELRGAGYDHFT